MFNMKKDITLYNHFHNGDLFYSRMLINILSNYFNITYYHNQSVPLFDDLDYVTELTPIPPNYDIHNTNLENRIVNTWIGQNGMYYVNQTPIPGCTFENHLKLVKDICNFYKIDLTNYTNNDYLPTINYDRLKNYNLIVNTFDKFKHKYKSLILISSGNVHSGQALNFDFKNIINILAKNNEDCLFLTTSDIVEDTLNVLNINKIVTLIPNLLHISLISNYCNIIIGRASGPFCFSHTKNNFNDITKTFISLSYNKYEGIFYNDGKNRNIWSNNYDEHNIINIIQDEIYLKKNNYDK